MKQSAHTLTMTMPEERCGRVELRLVEGGTWSYRPSEQHQTLVVLDGEAYITVEGDADDRFLHAGNELPLQFHKLTVVQGHPDCVVAIGHLN